MTEYTENYRNETELTQQQYDTFTRIGAIILVLSGKGGVGKSTVSTNLALNLATTHRVGLLDIDIHGPNIPQMLGISTHILSEDSLQQKLNPIIIKHFYNLKVASMGLVGYPQDEALIWRGPMRIGFIRQMFTDIIWGDLDYLIVDTPPGTGDEILTMAQIAPLMGALVITTPQLIAMNDAAKSIDFLKKLQTPLLGIIENMSGYECPHCNEISNLFPQGAGSMLADTYQSDLLAQIPFSPYISIGSDTGMPYIYEHPTSEIAQIYSQLNQQIHAIIQNSSMQAYRTHMMEALTRKTFSDKQQMSSTQFQPVRKNNST